MIDAIITIITSARGRTAGGAVIIITTATLTITDATFLIPSCLAPLAVRVHAFLLTAGLPGCVHLLWLRQRGCLHDPDQQGGT
jgi:hypothetical protein